MISPHQSFFFPLLLLSLTCALGSSLYSVPSSSKYLNSVAPHPTPLGIPAALPHRETPLPAPPATHPGHGCCRLLPAQPLPPWQLRLGHAAFPSPSQRPPPALEQPPPCLFVRVRRERLLGRRHATAYAKNEIYIYMLGFC